MQCNAVLMAQISSGQCECLLALLPVLPGRSTRSRFTLHPPVHTQHTQQLTHACVCPIPMHCARQVHTVAAAAHCTMCESTTPVLVLLMLPFASAKHAHRCCVSARRSTLDHDDAAAHKRQWITRDLRAVHIASMRAYKIRPTIERARRRSRPCARLAASSIPSRPAQQNNERGVSKMQFDTH